jgi:membrane protein DedA with SNARE-associated domain
MSDWVVRLIEQSGYLGVAFLMFLETIFPPIPSEVIMPVAGVAAANGRMHYGLVVLAGTAGAMLGNIVWYLAARALGVHRLEPIIRRHGRWLTMSWRDVERAEVWFRRNGVFFVFLGRLLPTVRSLVSIPAGLLRMRFKTFLLASTLGTFCWTALLAGAGYKLRENFAEVDQFLGPASNAVIVVLVAGYLWRLATHRGRDS